MAFLLPLLGEGVVLAAEGIGEAIAGGAAAAGEAAAAGAGEAVAGGAVAAATEAVGAGAAEAGAAGAAEAGAAGTAAEVATGGAGEAAATAEPIASTAEPVPEILTTGDVGDAAGVEEEPFIPRDAFGDPVNVEDIKSQLIAEGVPDKTADLMARARMFPPGSPEWEDLMNKIALQQMEAAAQGAEAGAAGAAEAAEASPEEIAAARGRPLPEVQGSPQELRNQFDELLQEIADQGGQATDEQIQEAAQLREALGSQAEEIAAARGRPLPEIPKPTRPVPARPGFFRSEGPGFFTPSEGPPVPGEGPAPSFADVREAAEDLQDIIQNRADLIQEAGGNIGNMTPAQLDELQDMNADIARLSRVAGADAPKESMVIPGPGGTVSLEPIAPAVPGAAALSAELPAVGELPADIGLSENVIDPGAGVGEGIHPEDFPDDWADGMTESSVDWPSEPGEPAGPDRPPTGPGGRPIRTGPLRAPPRAFPFGPGPVAVGAGALAGAGLVGLGLSRVNRSVDPQTTQHIAQPISATLTPERSGAITAQFRNTHAGTPYRIVGDNGPTVPSRFIRPTYNQRLNGLDALSSVSTTSNAMNQSTIRTVANRTLDKSKIAPTAQTQTPSSAKPKAETKQAEQQLAREMDPCAPKPRKPPTEAEKKEREKKKKEKEKKKAKCTINRELVEKIEKLPAGTSTRKIKDLIDRETSPAAVAKKIKDLAQDLKEDAKKEVKKKADDIKTRIKDFAKMKIKDTIGQIIEV